MVLCCWWYWVFLLLDMFCWRFLCFIPSKAHAGYLDLVRTSLRFCCSVLKCSGMEEAVLALCSNVLITLYFAAMQWCLSQCRYWSLWMGSYIHLWTELCYALMLPKCPEMGWNCLALCPLLWIWLLGLLVLLMCCKNFSLCSVCCITKVSSTNLFHNVGGLSTVLRAHLFKIFHVYVFYYQADWESHGCSLHLFIILTLEEKICMVGTN